MINKRKPNEDIKEIMKMSQMQPAETMITNDTNDSRHSSLERQQSFQII